MRAKSRERLRELFRTMAFWRQRGVQGSRRSLQTLEEGTAGTLQRGGEKAGRGRGE
jgi:hypothetical protein